MKMRASDVMPLNLSVFIPIGFVKIHCRKTEGQMFIFSKFTLLEVERI